MTILQRLLKYPHAAVFDTRPDSGTVLRLRHPLGASWTVVDEKLIAAAGETIRTYALADLSVGQLAARLTADGFEVSDFSAEFAGLSASVLVEGSGNQANSNGDRLQGFRSLLWALLGAYARELRTMSGQVREALRQMVIWQSEGEWTDYWGKLFGVPREGLSDAAYAERIPEEAFRLRVNAYAIEKAVRDKTGKDVRIEEPWRTIFRLDESQLSGTSRLYDGSSVGYHLIRPVSYSPINWDGVVEIIERNKAAGIIVMPPQAYSRIGLLDGLEGEIDIAHTARYGSKIIAWVFNRLDAMVLSGEELVLDASSASQLRGMLSVDPLIGFPYTTSRTNFYGSGLIYPWAPEPFTSWHWDFDVKVIEASAFSWISALPGSWQTTNTWAKRMDGIPASWATDLQASNVLDTALTYGISSQATAYTGPMWMDEIDWESGTWEDAP